MQTQMQNTESQQHGAESKGQRARRTENGATRAIEKRANDERRTRGDERGAKSGGKDPLQSRGCLLACTHPRTPLTLTSSPNSLPSLPAAQSRTEGLSWRGWCAGSKARVPARRTARARTHHTQRKCVRTTTRVRPCLRAASAPVLACPPSTGELAVFRCFSRVGGSFPRFARLFHRFDLLLLRGLL